MHTRVFRALLEEREIQELERRAGPLKADDHFLYLTTEDSSHLDAMLEADPGDGLFDAVQERGTLIRASSMILMMIPNTATIGDCASLLAASLAVFHMDPNVGRRLVQMIRPVPARPERK